MSKIQDRNQVTTGIMFSDNEQSTWSENSVYFLKKRDNAVLRKMVKTLVEGDKICSTVRYIKACWVLVVNEDKFANLTQLDMCLSKSQMLI